MYLVVCWTGHRKHDRSDAIPKYLTERLKMNCLGYIFAWPQKNSVTKCHKISPKVSRGYINLSNFNKGYQRLPEITKN